MRAATSEIVLRRQLRRTREIEIVVPAPAIDSADAVLRRHRAREDREAL